jgi:hypothetical protein
MSRPPHPHWFNYPNNIGWGIQVLKFIIMQFSSRSVFIPSTLSLCSSLKVRAQASHPYSTTGNITVLYISIFSFLDFRQKNKRFWTEL